MMLRDKKAIAVFNVLINEGIIPKEGQFEVTEEMLQASFETYPKLFPRKTTKPLKDKEVAYIKRLAAMNLTKLNIERASKVEVTTINKQKLQVKGGFVYVISNPMFEGYFKIGMTTDVKKRLQSYQTYDPLKRFKVEHYRFVEDRRKVEKQILNSFNKDLIKGEWVNSEEVKTIVTSL